MTCQPLLMLKIAWDNAHKSFVSPLNEAMGFYCPIKEHNEPCELAYSTIGASYLLDLNLRGIVMHNECSAFMLFTHFLPHSFSFL